VPSWTDPDWLADAHSWIRAQVERAGARVTGSIKADGPAHVYEVAVVELLARRRRDCVPELWASDCDRIATRSSPAWLSA
jgi:hypothetical protein